MKINQALLLILLSSSTYTTVRAAAESVPKSDIKPHAAPHTEPITEASARELLTAKNDTTAGRARPIICGRYMIFERRYEISSTSTPEEIALWKTRLNEATEKLNKWVEASNAARNESKDPTKSPDSK